MAVLALVVRVPFLIEPATALLTGRKGKWLDVDIPENISYDCARFLQSAPQGVTLTEEERKVYEDMKIYRLVELNLDSSLVARVPWTPEKTRGVGDRKYECAKCKVFRSITAMSSERHGYCGMCVDDDMDPKQFPDRGAEESCWVECSTKTCRAQYVVDNVTALNVRLALPSCPLPHTLTRQF
jgi:hypothetical protein